MSATMEKHIRIRVFFENAPKAPTWLLIDYESMYTIQDLENEIRQRYFANNSSLELSLDGCALPKSERTVILRDNDRVVVRERSHKESLSGQSLSSKKKRTVSANLEERTEEPQVIASSQDKTKKGSKKQSLQDIVREEKKKAGYLDYIFGEIDIEPTASRQDKIKNKKKKRKYNKCEDTLDIVHHSTEKGYKQKKKQKETKNPKQKKKQKRKTESPVWHFNQKDKAETLTPLQQGNRSKESISTEITQTMPLNYSVETEVSVAKSGPSAHKNRHESLGKGTGKDGVTKDDKVLEGDEEEQGVKKRRRRRRRQHKLNMEAEAIEPNSKKKKYTDNKIQKPFHAKYSKNSIDIYSKKNSHKVFDDSDPEEDTLPAQESTTAIEGTKTDKDEQMKSLQEAKQKLLEKVEQEFESVIDHSDMIDRHLPTTQSPNENVHEQTTNNKYAQEAFTNQPPHKVVQLQQTPIGGEQDDTGMSGVQLKLSALANGVPVYTRQQQKRYFNASRGKELSKEKQLNTSLTNQSVIITNDQPTTVQEPVKDSVCLDKQRPSILSPIVPPPVQDYKKFPPLQGTPRQGDKIAYKILELSNSYTPEVSNYKEGVVINFDHDSQLVEIETKSGEPDSRPQGKFHLDYDDDNNHHIEPKQSLLWESLLETRLLDIV